MVWCIYGVWNTGVVHKQRCIFRGFSLWAVSSKLGWILIVLRISRWCLASNCSGIRSRVGAWDIVRAYSIYSKGTLRVGHKTSISRDAMSHSWLVQWRWGRLIPILSYIHIHTIMLHAVNVHVYVYHNVGRNA